MLSLGPKVSETRTCMESESLKITALKGIQKLMAVLEIPRMTNKVMEDLGPSKIGLLEGPLLVQGGQAQ
jgi:hypothetical protein